jgi:hypothetical protein
VGQNLYQLCTRARSLSATQGSKQVTDTELASWVNEGVARLYDELTLADDSYYATAYDFPIGSGTEAAATHSLPADFYRLRGVTRWPDTPRAAVVTALSFDKRNGGEPGYTLTGDSIMILPWRNADMAGTYRAYYVPVPPQFGRALDITPSAGDGVFISPYSYLGVKYGLFSATDNGNNADVYNGGANDVSIIGVGGMLIDFWNAAGDDPGKIKISLPVITSATSFTADTFVHVYSAGNITQLDALMDPYAQFVVAYAARKALEKKQWDTSACDATMAMELERIKRSAPMREAEPEAAACLWTPRTYLGRGRGPWF